MLSEWWEERIARDNRFMREYALEQKRIHAIQEKKYLSKVIREFQADYTPEKQLESLSRPQLR